jgi:sec-independent protein translocase protein TatA
MPIKLGTPELLILLGIIVLLFGVGRIGRIAGELGQGIRQFRQGLTEPKEEAEAVEQMEDQAEKVV